MVLTMLERYARTRVQILFLHQEETSPSNDELASPGGEGGIRTLGTLRYTAFRERPVQPLLHLSKAVDL